MKKILTMLCLSTAVLAGGASHAGPVTVTDNYWGADGHGYGDVIGGALYNISSAVVSRSGDIVTIKINTAFAGNAGSDTWATTGTTNYAPAHNMGIGYGDLLLSNSWTPVNGTCGGGSTDANHCLDNMGVAGSTKWKWGLALDDRWDAADDGGSFTLYNLNGSTNANNLWGSQDFLSCAIGSSCYYRNGQAVAVKTASSDVSVVKVNNQAVTGRWTVDMNQDLVFTLNVYGTALASVTDLALHWGETCGNDVIEGVANISKVPEPGSMAMFALGLFALAALRQRRRN